MDWTTIRPYAKKCGCGYPPIVGTHEVVGIEECQIEVPEADAVIREIRRLLPSFHMCYTFGWNCRETEENEDER